VRQSPRWGSSSYHRRFYEGSVFSLAAGQFGGEGAIDAVEHLAGGA
jgi:hypothetical protein